MICKRFIGEIPVKRKGKGTRGGEGKPSVQFWHLWKRVREKGQCVQSVSDCNAIAGKFAQVDGKSSSQSTSLKKSCVCRNGSVSINSFAKSLAWCSPLEVWPGQKYGGGSRRSKAWVLSQLHSLKQESWATHFHGHHIDLCTFPSDIVVNLHISKGPSLVRQPNSH